MIRAIFFDVDGTLVNDKSQALKSTREAIRRAREKGILCGVATGRSPVGLSALIDYLELDVYVTYNGQLVFTNQQTIFAEAFSPAALAEVVEYAEERHRQIMFGGRDRLEGSTLMNLSQKAWVKRLASLLPRKLPVLLIKRTVQRFSPHRKKGRYRRLSILQEPIYQCILFASMKEQEKFDRLMPQSSFQRSNPYSVDIIPKGGSKLRGIEKFLATQGISLSEVMAFGDHHNDVEMLEGVGIGVAMGNAEAQTKKSADYVTATNNQDGIYQALTYFNVI